MQLTVEFLLVEIDKNNNRVVPKIYHVVTQQAVMSLTLKINEFRNSKPNKRKAFYSFH